MLYNADLGPSRHLAATDRYDQLPYRRRGRFWTRICAPTATSELEAIELHAQESGVNIWAASGNG